MAKRRKKGGGIRRVVQNELLRRGLHTKAAAIVAAMARYGLHVDEDLVNRVRMELHKGQGATPGSETRQIDRRVRRRRVQKVPEKRPRRK